MRNRAGTLAVALAVASAIGAVACGGGETSDAGGDPAPASAHRDTASATPADSALLLAERVMEALGGEEAWNGTRYLAFRWVVARPDGPLGRFHAWDRYEGRYRLEVGEGEDAVLALFDVDEVSRDPDWGKVPAGRVWVGGRPLEGAARDSALARAYGAFINDSYWLLMPFKWRDPGVHLTYEGREVLEDGREYAVVHLAFEPDLGITDDRYWAYVDPETGRMAAWRFHLERQEEPGPVIRWSGWTRVGALALAADRVWPEGERRLWFEDMAASARVPEGSFDPPPTAP